MLLSLEQISTLCAGCMRTELSNMMLYGLNAGISQINFSNSNF